MNKMENPKIKWLFMELTNSCNFDCTFCPNDIMKRKREKINLQTAKKIIDEIINDKNVNIFTSPDMIVELHVMGEPLLHPDIFEIIKYAEENGIRIYLVTNGSLLTEKTVDKLFDVNLSYLVISYQSADEQSFKLRRARNLTFEKYQFLIYNTIRKKIRRKARTDIHIHLLNTKYFKPRNAHCIDSSDNALDVFNKLNKFSQQLMEEFDLDFKGHFYVDCNPDNLLDVPAEHLYETLPGVAIVFKKANSFGNNLTDRKIIESETGFCSAPFDQFAILSNGECTICCQDYEGSTNIGNINEKSIKDIWLGERMEIIRKEILNNKLCENVCKKCKGIPSSDESYNNVLMKIKSYIKKCLVE